MDEADTAVPAPASAGSVAQVFLVFLRLGLTSFGGPAAHIGYFRAEFVERRRWLDDAAFAGLLALCQFLPGPASSQLGFSIGLRRAGPAGALAAWTGFTLPSAVLMTALAFGVGLLNNPAGRGVVHGLKLVAVAVVARAVLAMARSFATDRARATLAVAALALASLIGGGGQILALLVGAAVGREILRDGLTSPPQSGSSSSRPLSRRWGIGALAVFIALAAGSSLAPGAAVFAAFFRTGALVFGGGHVVLPLLQAQVVAPGWVTPDAFLPGYAAAQALPGPLFSLAAYLGALQSGVVGAVLALVAISLPGLLLLMAALPFWSAIAARPAARGAVAGANAAVVGVLAAALYDPLWTGSVHGGTDLCLVGAGFAALTVWRAPPVLVVAAGALAGLWLSPWA